MRLASAWPPGLRSSRGAEASRQPPALPSLYRVRGPKPDVHLASDRLGPAFLPMLLDCKHEPPPAIRVLRHTGHRTHECLAARWEPRDIGSSLRSCKPVGPAAGQRRRGQHHHSGVHRPTSHTPGHRAQGGRDARAPQAWASVTGGKGDATSEAQRNAHQRPVSQVPHASADLLPRPGHPSVNAVGAPVGHLLSGNSPPLELI